MNTDSLEPPDSPESRLPKQSSTCCTEIDGKVAFNFSEWVKRLFDSLEQGTEVEPLPDWVRTRQ